MRGVPWQGVMAPGSQKRARAYEMWISDWGLLDLKPRKEDSKNYGVTSFPKRITVAAYEM